MDFWTFLALVLSLFQEIFNLELFTINIPGAVNGQLVEYTCRFGHIILGSIVIGVFIHLLTPSARGI